MPKKTFPLESNGPERLEASWGITALSKFTVKLDGATIKSVSFMQAITKGVDFQLPDGDHLRLQLVPGTVYDFDLLRNGKSIVPQGAGTSPGRQMANAGNTGTQIGAAQYVGLLIIIALTTICVLAILQPTLEQFFE